MKSLTKLIQKSNKKIIGMMSGTSCDGIDLVLLQVSGAGLKTRFEILQRFNKSYSARQKKYLLELTNPETSDVKKISQANFYLAQIWVQAIKEMLAGCGEKPQNIDLIGSHGQTVYHQPTHEKILKKNVASTLQIGDPAVLAQLTGITTVGDFRVADVALGGQGAPLVPYFDWLYFSKFKKNILALNIGGIANFTFIPADGDFDKVFAFDTGPGNMLIDQLMQRLYELPYDREGEKAFIGKFSEKLFDLLIKMDPYPALKPPKSTGREHYGEEFVLKMLEKSLRWRIQEPEVINTVTTYTAYTIWKAYSDFIKEKIELLMVSGGGSHNIFLMKSLQNYFKNVSVEKVNDHGLDEDFKEAICFAILANECVCGNPSNVPRVTGASKRAVLGKICPA